MNLTLFQALKQGIAAHKRGQVKEADRCYTAILKTDPKHPDANHNMGVLAVDIGKLEAALPFFRTAIEVKSSVGQYWLSYVNALMQLNRIDEARTVFYQALKKGISREYFIEIDDILQQNIQPKLSNKNKLKRGDTNQSKKLDLNRSLKLAQKHASSGLNSEAKNIYREILREFPKNKKAILGLKALSDTNNKTIQTQDVSNHVINSLIQLYNNAQYEEILVKVSELLAEHPGSASLYNIMGSASRSSGNLEEAKKAYLKAIEINSDYADAYNNLGVTLQELGNLNEAITAYEKAIALKPDSAAPYYLNIGNVFRSNRKFSEAEKAYKKALEIDPSYADAYNNLGITLQELNNPNEAIKAYKKALALKPSDERAYNNLGLTFKERGQLEEAIEAYEKAISIKSDYADALENYLGLQVQLPNNALFTKSKLIKPIENIPTLNKRPKFHIYQAISAFIKADYILAKENLSKYDNILQHNTTIMSHKERVFCSAYRIFLDNLIDTSGLQEQDLEPEHTVFHLGESHCLSFAHQRIKIDDKDYNVLPRITFGGKAYHFSKKGKNAFKAITKTNFDSLPNGSKVFISFGEIDCRQNEGFITASAKLEISPEVLIDRTVNRYLQWFMKINKSKKHSLYFFNVPAPIYNNNLSIELNQKIAAVIKSFNQAIAYYQFGDNAHLVDVYSITSSSDGFSKGNFHIDDRHLSHVSLTKIEEQLTAR